MFAGPIGGVTPKVGQRFVPPQLNRLSESRDDGGVVLPVGGNAGLCHEPPEAMKVDQIWVDVQPVPPAGYANERAPEFRLAQRCSDPTDHLMQCLAAGADMALPEIIDDHVEPDRLANMVKEYGEKTALFCGAEVLVLAQNVQRCGSQNDELHWARPLAGPSPQFSLALSVKNSNVSIVNLP
jgi:hypothetical protein